MLTYMFGFNMAGGKQVRAFLFAGMFADCIIAEVDGAAGVVGQLGLQRTHDGLPDQLERLAVAGDQDTHVEPASKPCSPEAVRRCCCCTKWGSADNELCAS
jgi:hypothetical protein